MKSLLWQILFFRILQEQRKLFAIAILTVSLGVALALGIRLGTQSAVRSLEQTLTQTEGQTWTEPLLATTAEAKVFLRELGLREGGVLFAVLEGTLVSTQANGDEEDSQSIQVQIPMGQLISPSGDLPQADQEYAGLTLLTGQECLNSYKSITQARISGRIVPVRFRPLDSLSSGPCRLLIGSPPFFATDLWQEVLNRAPLRVLFPKNGALNEEDFARLLEVAAQIPGLETDANRTRISRLEDVTASFRTNLQLMGFIALFIGFAMVHHIFSLVVAKQSKTLSVLTALGIAKKRQLRVLVTLAAVLGLASSALGTALGLVAGAFLSNVTSSTVQNLYDSFVDARNFYWDRLDLAYGFALGFAACLLGSLHPLYKLKKLPVAQIMRDGSFEAHDSGLTLKQNLYLTLLTAVVALLCLNSTIVWNRIPLTALFACLCVLVGSALFAQLVGRIVYEHGQLKNLKYSWATQLRLFMSPQAAVIVQVLTLTFTLTFGVKGMAESFRTTLADWSRETLTADVWIRTVGGSGIPLPSFVLKRLEDAQGKEAKAVDRLSIGPASLQLTSDSDEKPVLLAAARFAQQAQVAPMKILQPNSIGTSQQELALTIAEQSMTCSGTLDDPCPAYISEPIAVHFTLREPLGQVICPTYSAQQVCFRIRAIYQDFGSDQGVILTDEKVFSRLLQNAPRPSFSNVYLNSPGSLEAEQLTQELRSFVDASNGELSVETLPALQARILKTFDNTFRVTDALYILCGIVAIIATLSCLNLQILLRSKEWTLQWTMGIGRQRLVKRFAVWSAVLACLAAVVSLLGGWLLSAILVYSVNYYSFGYSLTLSVPWQLPVVVLTVATVSGFISGHLQAQSLKENISLAVLTRE